MVYLLLFVIFLFFFFSTGRRREERSERFYMSMKEIRIVVTCIRQEISTYIHKVEEICR